jgi:hypothetical protein
MMKAHAVVATTTLATYSTKHEIIRAECALKMVQSAVEQGYVLVAVDGGSPAGYIEALQERGALVFPQEVSGMGNARREALRHAREAAPEGHAIVWSEPEKYPLMTELRPAVAKVTDELYDLVMLRRRSLESYPPEQAMAYQLIALAVKYLTGIDSDFGWGPTVMSRQVVDYYLSYESMHGDLWDGIHCPKLRIIKDGRPWTVLTVDYQHPPEQTEAETGMELFLKRVRQVDQLVNALTDEANRLDMRQ